VLIPHTSSWPQKSSDSEFDHALFYTSLQQYQNEPGCRATKFGTSILYAEVLTSTNTILEKNQKLLNHLPNGFTATAGVQIAGRGRGNNVWVSPRGSLIYSTLLRHSITLSNSAPVVFVQYLAAISIAEGIKSYAPGYESMPVRLKWPNDVYAEDPENPGKFVKICGILVNSSFSDGVYNLVVGCGINAINKLPTTSLNAIRPKGTPVFSLEKLLARILTKFEDIYTSFCRTGFSADLEKRYYGLWLHSQQIVTLETEGGARARVVGITRDWGLLKVEELGWEDQPTGRVWTLQADGNSFDFFKGLLKAKA
jgi:biotin--protein ligase